MLPLRLSYVLLVFALLLRDQTPEHRKEKLVLCEIIMRGKCSIETNEPKNLSFVEAENWLLWF